MIPRRWLWLVVLLALPALTWAIVKRTDFVVSKGLTGVMDLLAISLALILGLIWLLALSGFSPRARLGGMALIALLGGTLFFLFRKEGLMGDSFPQIVWRWKAGPAATLPALETSARSDATPPKLIARHDDFPQFLGPSRSNEVSGDALPPEWFLREPKELWRIAIGAGWGGFAVIGPYAYTLEQRDDREIVVCYDALTGKPVWFHADPVRFEESMGGVGPRTTPTFHDGRLFTLGATGILNCFDAATGDKFWARDTLKELGQSNLMWGKSCSPLVSGDRVIVTLARSDASVAAYALDTGAPVWTADGDTPGYGSPIEGSLAGNRQLVLFQANGLEGFDPSTGARLWSYPVDPASAHTASPRIVDGDKVLFGAAYGKGSHLVQIQPGSLEPEKVWHSRQMKPKFADFVVREKVVYVLDDGVLAGVSLANGRRLWRGGRYGHGQILGVGGRHLIIQDEQGDVIVSEVTPKGETVKCRFSALSSKTWNHSALAGRLLLVRNDREAVAFEYPKK